jgi:hypothetical protein
LPGSSGVMKPYPLESLNHLTVPVAIEKHLLYRLVNGRWRRLANQILALERGDRSMRATDLGSALAPRAAGAVVAPSAAR